MSQQPDPTIPFDASVVDEEALRALRAVQRQLPVGDGVASGNLVGGTEAVAAFGMVPGAPAGGGLRAAHNVGANQAEQMPSAGSSPLAPLDSTSSADMLTAPRGELIEQRPIFVAPSFANAAAKAATSHPPAGHSSSRPDIALASEIAPAAPDASETPVVTPPSVERPEPEVPVDIAADAPLVHVSDAAGLEDQAIALDLSAALFDTDGSEVLSVSIHGVPEGASLSHGTRQVDGSWSVSLADLAHLNITPPKDFSGEFNLTLRAVAQENSGDGAVVEASFRVHVGAVADAPSVTVADAHGQEDTPIRLDGLGGALRDVDGSESLSFVLSGVPVGATLSAGVRQPDGSWLLTPTQLTGLTFTPPSQVSGRFTLTLTAIAKESEAGVPSARTSAIFTVDFDPVADAGTISGKSAGAEDTAILLKPDFMLPDNDGSESWSAMTQVAGLPAGASLSHGTQIAPGIWQVSTADLQAGLVTIRPAEHSDADFTLTLTAILTDNGNSTSVSRMVTGTHTVNVTAVADVPTVSAQNVTGDEDQPIPLDLSAALVDNDGSEVLSVSILAVPDGAKLSHGIKQPDGSWSVPVADLAHLSLTPPKDFSGTIDLTLKATARESENGTTATTTVPFKVQVEAVADAPDLTVSDAVGREDQDVALDVSALLVDVDRSEVLSVVIAGLPAGARLTQGLNNGDGSWTLTPDQLAGLRLIPPADWSGTATLTVRAHAREIANGEVATTERTLAVQVQAEADAPVVSARDVTGQEDRPIALELAAAVTDRDGSEGLAVSLDGVPVGASLSHGTRQADGSWSVAPADLPHLSLTAPQHFAGTFDLTLRATAQETLGGPPSSRTATFRVTVGAIADAPEVSVVDVSGPEDTPLSLAGLGGALRDVDGSESLSFVLGGLPAGARLNAGIDNGDGSWTLTPAELTGLTLTPPANVSGRYTLTLTGTATESAGGSTASTARSFTVEVKPVVDAATISGASAGAEDTAIPIQPTFSLQDQDGSESWSAFTAVAGVPLGATLNLGQELTPGTWQVATADLQAGRVTLRPGPHSDADFVLTFTAVVSDSGGGTSVSQTVTGTQTVTVTAVADAPVVSAKNVSGDEDQAIALDLSAALTDTDGSETLALSIRGEPEGTVLSHGSKQPDGSWSVPVADLAHLSLTPPKNFSGTIDLTLEATTRESENGTTATATVPFQVRVTDVSDAPVLAVHNASGKEDTEIPLSLSAALTDIDGSEEITISILDVPDRAKLSHGSKQPDGSWSVPVADLADLTVTPPKNFSGTIDLTVEATAISSNGATAVTRAPVRVQVEAVADAPGLTVSDAVGREDQDIALDVSAALADTDRSEVLSVVISNLPEGARLSDGLDNGDGTWTLTPGQLTGLKLIPAEDWSGTATLSVLAQAREISNGDIATTPGSLTVTVAGVADTPQLGAKDVTGLEDQPIALDLSAAVTDRDGSESLTVLVLDVPDGATLSHGTKQEDGSWNVPEKDLAHLSITPPKDFSGTIDLTFQVTAHEKDGGDGATAEIPFKVQVGAVADAPTVTVEDAQGHEDTPISLAGLGGALQDTDKSEDLSFVLSGIPAGARLSAGTDNGDGSWTLTPAELTGLTLTPPANVSGSYTLTLTSVATEKSNGSHAETSATFIVGINPVADNAGITGSVSGGEDTDITIKPTFSLNDNDGSESWSAFARITGVPTGATLKGSSSLTEVSSGVWQVSTADLLAGRVTIKPPHDSDKDFTLTFSATQTDTGNGKSVSQEITGTYAVTVTAFADAPTVVVANAQGYEDTPISLAGLGGALSDVDGSESLSFVLSGIPAGAKLSAGTDKGNGNWKLTPGQLNGLTLTPPANFSGSLSLKLTAVATEGLDNRPTASTSADFTVGVNPVLDNSSVGGNTSGNEDADIPLKPVFSLADNDKSETWSDFTQITGLPAGATLKGSSPTFEGPTGVWNVSTKDLMDGRVTVTPPHDSDKDFKLTFTATQKDTGNGTSVSRTVTGTYDVTVNAVADAPTITPGKAEGDEDTPINLNLSAALTDEDGSEVLTVRIIGVPEGAKLSDGEELPDGSWSVPVADLADLTITPPKDFSGTIKLTVEATATEKEGGSQKSTSVDIEVKVEAVADTPELRVSPAFGDEDKEIPLHVTARATDLDNSETIVFYRLEWVPDGAVIRAGHKVLTVDADGNVIVPANVIGSLTITPPANSDADIPLKVVAISTEPNGSTAASPAKELLVTVRADADAPVFNVTSASGPEDSDIPLNLTATLPDGDTSETLSFVISGLPKGALLSAGTYRGPGIWSLTAEEAKAVKLTPPANFSGKIDLTVTAVTQEGKGGDQDSTTVRFPVHVDPVVDNPAVVGSDGKAHWGTMSGPEDKPIELHLDPGLTDRDGSEKVVGNIIIGNIPAGAVLRFADDSPVDVSPDGFYRIPVEKMAGVTLTMPQNSDVAETLSIRMTIQDTNGDGKTVTKEISGHIAVDPRGVADEPVFTTQPSSGTGHNSTSNTTGWIPLKISAELVDTDKSEALSVWVRDVPAGASLSHGIPAGGGVWLVPADKLPSLAIRPPASSSGDTSVIKLNVSVVVTEREGDQIVRSAPVEVTVMPPGSGGDGTGTGPGDGTGGTPVTGPKAQTPSLSIGSGSATTQEDQSVALSISAKTLDTDNGSETLGIRIDNVPEGARLSAGLRDPKTGSWVLRPDQLAGLELIPPHDFAGTITLNVTAVSTEKTGSEATQSSPLNITVEAVADGASISANPPAGKEDVEIPLNLAITPNDGDGSETVVAVLLSGLPTGARIEGPGVTDHNNGTWSINPADLKTVRMTPPPNWTGDLPLTITVTMQEASNDKTHTTSRNISIPVEAVPDAPTLSLAEASGQEDGTVELKISALLMDTDRSEVLSVVIAGLPAGARLTQGLNNGDGSWTLTPDQLAGLRLIPPADWSGSVSLTVRAHAREIANGEVATTERTLTVQVQAAADAPVVSARDVTGQEDLPIALELAAHLTDRDGSEGLAVSLDGVPVGASLSHGTRQADGSWSVAPADLPHLSLTAPEHFAGTFDLTLRATTQETLGGPPSSRTASFRVTVGAIADAPEVSVVDVSGPEDTPLSLAGLGGALRDVDGSESLSFVLGGLPAGARLSAGTDNGDGSWTLTPAELTGLTLTPPANVSGRYTLTLTGTATESAGGSTASTARSFTVEVKPVVDAATISGASAGAEDTAIPIQPTFSLQDQDGSESWSAFTAVAGVPLGATLNLGQELTPGTWQVATADLQAGRVTLRPGPHSDADFTLTFTAVVSDSGGGTSVSQTVTGTQAVTVTAVADAPVVSAKPVTGDEDQAIALDLSAALADTDGSETLAVSIRGVPEGFRLSHGTSVGGGEWQVTAGSLAGLKLIPADDANGTFNLTLQATSREASGGHTTKTTASFTVTIDPVNDAPTLVLTAPQHATEGAHQADLIGNAQASDIDSSQLGGATITLSGAQPSDRLDFEGFTLHAEDGRTMIGNTGIEVVGGGYAAGSSILTLSGSASPGTYASVLQSLVLESGDPSGLAAGTRSIGVVLRDSAGAESIQKTVDVVVDDLPPAQLESHGAAQPTGSENASGSSAADILLLMSDDMSGLNSDSNAAWTEQVESGSAHEVATHHDSHLDQPGTDHVQIVDDLQAETLRVSWS